MTLAELEALIHADVTQRFLEYQGTQAPGPEPGPGPGPDPGPGPIVIVTPEDDLQAALDDPKIAVIKLVAGATYSGSFVIRRAVEVHGMGATIQSTSGPAIFIASGDVSDVVLRDIDGLSTADAVFRFGSNGPTQTALSQVPRRILAERCRVLKHRGKRGFEINSAETLLLDCVVEDCYSPALVDSQGVWIHNTPGDVTVRGGHFSAGSEVIMVGGDTMKIPGVIPTKIVIEECALWRPLAWKTDGVKRAIKTGLELKTGYDVTIRRVTIDGCWKDAQDGYAMTFTPRSGGAIRNVLVDECTMTNVSSGFNITGHDEAGKPATPTRTTEIYLRNSSLKASKAKFGGRGILCQLGMSPETVDFENMNTETDGNHLMYCADGASSGEAKIGRFRVVNSSARPGAYGIQRSGGPVNGTDVPQWITLCQVEDNTFTGAMPAFKTNFPTNKYV